MNEQRREANQKMLEPMGELIQTEKKYLENLKKCIDFFIKEFDEATRNGTYATLKPLKYMIFGNLEKIFHFHNNYLLHQLLEFQSVPEKVGSSFIASYNSLKELYIEYVWNKNRNMRILENPEVIILFSGVNERNQINESIGSLLIQPVQRIARYPLLMAELLKCSPKSAELAAATEAVTSLLIEINDGVNLSELNLSDCNVDELGQFVTQDTLTVWEPKAYFKGRGKERQVFLFENFIVFAKKRENPSISKYQFEKEKEPWPLNKIYVVEHVHGSSCRFGVRFGDPKSDSNLTYLEAASESIKVKWVLKIRGLTTGILPLGLGVSSALSVTTLSSTTTTSARCESHKSGAIRRARQPRKPSESDGENTEERRRSSRLSSKPAIYEKKVAKTLPVSDDEEKEKKVGKSSLVDKIRLLTSPGTALAEKVGDLKISARDQPGTSSSSSLSSSKKKSSKNLKTHWTPPQRTPEKKPRSPSPSESTPAGTPEKRAKKSEASGVLKGRVEEYESLREWILESKKSQSSLSIYISGQPGTGKTATTMRVLKSLRKDVYSCIVNCASTNTKKALFKTIFESLDFEGKPNVENFEGQVKRLKMPLVLVLDEIDHLANRKDADFQWPDTLSHKVIILGIANSIDLTERLLPKLMLVKPPKRLVFEPYTKDEIVEILNEKMEKDDVGNTPKRIPVSDDEETVEKSS